MTNDDGIYGPGLMPLIDEMRKLGKVISVVPDQERSGVSHSITLHKPLRVQKINKGLYVANGTPADCVRFAVITLFKNKIDLVVSGVNTGPNLGQDVVYSGTVAGAREAAMMNIPSFSVSVGRSAKPNFNLSSKTARLIAKKILGNYFPENIYLNVNVPDIVKGYSITTLGQRIYDQDIECRKDPRGERYYWLAGKNVSGISLPGTDIHAVEKGLVSITPLNLNPVAMDFFESFNQWIKDLN